MFLSFIFLSLLFQSLFALPLLDLTDLTLAGLTSTPYYIRSAYMGNCIVRGRHGATVVTAPFINNACPGNAVVRIAPHSGGYQIKGQAGLFIRPSRSGHKLVWDKKPFAWHFEPVGMGLYLIEGHGRVWLDDPHNPKFVDLVKTKSTLSGDYFWVLDIA